MYSRYSWCSKRLVENNFYGLTNLKQSDLIPLESSNLNERKSRKQIVIGHNVGFDRSFIKEQYYIEVPCSSALFSIFIYLFEI